MTEAALGMTEAALGMTEAALGMTNVVWNDIYGFVSGSRLSGFFRPRLLTDYSFQIRDV